MKLLWRLIVPVMLIFLLTLSSSGFSSALSIGGSSANSQSIQGQLARLRLQILPSPFATHEEADVAVPGGNRVCPSGEQCVYVADGIGGVSVIEKTKLIATIYVNLTKSDPYSCPESAYYWWGEILVADPCGNNYAGELRTLNVTTNKWGNPITIAGSELVSAIGNPSNGDLYVSNFGYSEVTVLSSPTKVAATISTCGYYPEFMAYYKGDVYVSNQQGYNSKNGTYEGCVDIIHGTSRIATIWNPNEYEEFAGVAVNQVNGRLYVIDPYVYVNDSYGLVYVYTSNGKFVTTISPPENSSTLWENIYDPAVREVAVFSGSDNAFFINSKNQVVKIVSLVNGSANACYNSADKSIYVSTIGTSSSYEDMITSNYSVKAIVISSYGAVDPYGCGVS